MCGTVLDNILVKRTRRARQCFGCGRIIPKGTMAWKSVSVDGRDLSSDYDCLDCSEFMKTAKARGLADDDGCIWPWSFAEEPYAQFPILEPRSVA